MLKTILVDQGFGQNGSSPPTVRADRDQVSAANKTNHPLRRRIMAIASRSTAIAAFASRDDAQQAIRGLLLSGFEPDRLGLILPDVEAPDAAMEFAEPITLCVGGMFRSLIGVELPETEVRYYEEDLLQGRPLVMVRAGDRYQDAVDILDHCGGRYLAAF
jgi:hypothetical protein